MPAVQRLGNQAARRLAALATAWLTAPGRALAQSGGRLKIATAQVLKAVVVTSQFRKTAAGRGPRRSCSSPSRC